MQVILTMVFVKETRWMATLEELRGQLDVVDDQIVKLYEEIGRASCRERV